MPAVAAVEEEGHSSLTRGEIKRPRRRNGSVGGDFSSRLLLWREAVLYERTQRGVLGTGSGGHLPLCPPSSISAASLPPRPAVMKATKTNNAVRWQGRAAERKDYLSCTGEA